MKKSLHIFIAACWASIFFVGCGENLSPEVQYCQNQVDNAFQQAEKDKRAGPKKMSQLKESCSEYKGSTEPGITGENFANKDMSKFMMESMIKTCVTAGVMKDEKDMKGMGACLGKYWATPDE